MARYSLEELLRATDLSDDSDVDRSDGSASTLPQGGRVAVNYNEVLRSYLQDRDSDCLSVSPGDRSPQTPFGGVKSTDTDAWNTPKGCSASAELSSTCVDSISRANSLTAIREPGYLSPPRRSSTSRLTDGEETQTGSNDAEQPSKPEDEGGAERGMPAVTSECNCTAKYGPAIRKLTKSSCPYFSAIRSMIIQQLQTSSIIHRIAYINNVKSDHLGGILAPLDDEDEADSDFPEEPSPTLYPAKTCLDSLGISLKRLKPPEKPDLLIRLRHNVSIALEKLRLFNDGFINIDATKVNTTAASPHKPYSPSCIAVNNRLLVVGTSGGSLLVCDITNHRSKRQFSPHNVDVGEDETGYAEDLVWREVDCQNDASVTCLDVLPESNWICAGYSNAMVKLVQLNKDAVKAKSSDAPKSDAADGSVASESGPSSRGFGLMAGAVSALGGFKKSGAHVICSAKPFNDAVTFCKFTLGESHDEIFCANRNSIALLTYSKTVLSHNLNVKTLDAFSERLLEHEEIVDVACLSSNPQSKFITGVPVSGLVALATIKRCIVIATRPELSILFRVPFTDRPKAVQGSDCTIPSITWMILNNSGDIKPVLLIVLSSRISFTLCNLSAGKRGSPPVSCSHIGYIRFDSAIRHVYTVSRDMFAVVDYNNVMHILQVNVFDNVMHYDVVRSFDFKEAGLADLWMDRVNISPTIAVHVRTIKMAANSYKKFSALVSEMFQGKRNEQQFDLRVLSFYISTSKGIWSSEIHSWIKSIGDLTATKHFANAFAISLGLCIGMLPGLLDYKAYVDNIQKLILYVLHQSSAQIIRLSKLMDTAQMASIDDEDNDSWTDQVKDDINTQIDTLCCCMLDICLCLGLYDSLNDLIYRCFATVGMQRVFVKYVLLNLHVGRIDLARLKPAIFDSIFEFYEKMLDNVLSLDGSHSGHVEDWLALLCDEVDNRQRGQCPIQRPGQISAPDARVILYGVLCNQMSRFYIFCSRNEIPFAKEKAICTLSKHCQWHAVVHCPELIGDDISVALEILYSELSNKLDKLRNDEGTSSADCVSLPWSQSEGLFVTRVFFSFVNSFLTFANCGLPQENAATNFCKVLGYLTSSTSFKPSFPITSDVKHARPELSFEDEAVDFDNMDLLTFKAASGDALSSPALQLLISTSPRLLFACLMNLLMTPDSIFEANAELLGTKIDIFNFVLESLIGCLSILEASQSTFTVRCMMSMFVLGVSAFSESFYLSLRTQVVAMYTLLTEVGDVSHDPFLDPGELTTDELILPDGSFNNAYYLHSFCKKSDDLLENVRQFNMSSSTTRELLKLYIRRSLIAIYRKYDCEPSWTHNVHFANMKRICMGLQELAGDFDTRLFLCDVAADYANAISACQTAGSDIVFSYLRQCLNCIKAGSTAGELRVNELVLSDPSVQKEFVATLMDALPRLIKVDMKSATALLVDTLSVSNMASVFKETALHSSQDLIISTLGDFPELKLAVLDALLGISANDSATSTDKDAILSVLPGLENYFIQYLKLLCDHDPRGVCPFLKRQRRLDFSTCLPICMSANIHDAVAYLFMRAGDFESSSRWLLDAFRASGDDIEMCHRLIGDAYELCNGFSEFTSHESLENLWFSILRCLVDVERKNGDASTLIERVFNVGILKFTRLTRALVELEAYESVSVSMFKHPLRMLLCDVDFQTFAAKASSTMGTTVLCNEFRQSLDCNKRGVIVEGSVELRRNHDICGVCRRKLWSIPQPDAGGGVDSPPTEGAPRNDTSPSTTAASNLSPLEKQLGIIYTLQTSSKKQAAHDTNNRASSLHLPNLYQDQLSSLLSMKPSSGGLGRAKWMASTSGISSAIPPDLRAHIRSYTSQSMVQVYCRVCVSGRYADRVVPGRCVDEVGPARAVSAEFGVVTVETLQYAGLSNMPVSDVFVGHQNLRVQAYVAFLGIVLDDDGLAFKVHGPPGGALF
ncbi:vacuolar sorting-associated 8 homolog, putative [Babesia ovata]|uniref:Vacuolar sorting-associated 8 homolog, putative n=1 Tax=Babesia ovata TaxID=189622 RepID=A0A2H6K9R0_9APIC|nr:vacuolar sorting-associated 8 homolog, putative [Babesia ovata]GBE59742.1 vacuolar sorting-associated 8 homolog, putative [Babesia ovata]